MGRWPAFLDPNSQPFLMSLRKIDPPLFLLKSFYLWRVPWMFTYADNQDNKADQFVFHELKMENSCIFYRLRKITLSEKSSFVA